MIWSYIGAMVRSFCLLTYISIRMLQWLDWDRYPPYHFQKWFDKLHNFSPRHSYKFLYNFHTLCFLPLCNEWTFKKHFVTFVTDLNFTNYHIWYFHSLRQSAFGAKIYRSFFTWSARPLYILDPVLQSDAPLLYILDPLL
jgi:hypothetical protein